MPEVPPVSRSGPLEDPGPLAEAVTSVFDLDGPLAQTLTAFEPRPAQRAMAVAVAEAFTRGGVLLAEAGTGTGKTLAYLVPAVLSGRRVLVSTGTKTLQEQIYTKDLPLLREALGVSFRAEYMKGRGNYLCLHRYEAFREGGDDQAHTWSPIFDAWLGETPTGDRAELDQLPEDAPFWNAISASAENCIGRECARYDDCFVTRMRQRAAEADLVIVNHHLLCADAAVRQQAYGEVIPACSYAIVDEAHQLEDVATQYFGFAVSNHRVDDLVRDGERCLALEVLLRQPEDLRAAVERVRDRASTFFNQLLLMAAAGRPPAGRPPAGRPGEERRRVTADSLVDSQDAGAALGGALDTLEASIQLRQPAGGEAVAGEIAADPAGAIPAGAIPLDEDLLGLSRRAAELRNQLRFLLRANDLDFVYFLETRGRTVSLRAAPIDVSTLIREVLFERLQATVLTSATLSVEGSFEYIRTRLGVDGVQRPSSLRLPSEFDFTRQTLLYLPAQMPDPRLPTFAPAAAREILSILRHTRGRAFVLFTSYAMLREVKALVAGDLEYPLLVQGTAPRASLLDRFRATPHAVLFATAGFWQGVDVIGEALSCVIVDRLPFASPGDPITAARLEAVAQRGGEPFSEYQVPLAILTLLQGLGRLIRHRQDRGVFAILDPRLHTKPYGRRFLASLPPAPVTRTPDDITRFFAMDGTDPDGRTAGDMK